MINKIKRMSRMKKNEREGREVICYDFFLFISNLRSIKFKHINTTTGKCQGYGCPRNGRCQTKTLFSEPQTICQTERWGTCPAPGLTSSLAPSWGHGCPQRTKLSFARINLTNIQEPLEEKGFWGHTAEWRAGWVTLTTCPGAATCPVPTAVCSRSCVCFVAGP